MITAEQTAKALFMLEAGRFITGMPGQTMVWHDLISNAVPLAEDDDLMVAVRKIASMTNQDTRSSWITVGDVIAQLRSVRRVKIEADLEQQRRLESGRPTVVSINIKQLMADTNRGLSPDEVGRRARERSERDSMKSKPAKEEA